MGCQFHHDDVDVIGTTLLQMTIQGTYYGPAYQAEVR